MGVIVRTAGTGCTKAEIKRDFEYLLRLWENVRELTRRMLESEGLRVREAANGQEALDEIRRRAPGLIILDLMMPEMDGYETMQQIRKQPQFHNLPIIALTAKAMRGDRQKCIEAGANDYLSKPIDVDKLMSLLRVWLY